MLRKDVKLGFAIGGIMLAVVIVYVLVVPGDRKSVSVVTDDGQSPGKADVVPIPVPSDGKSAEPESATPANAPPADPNSAVQSPTTVPSGSSAAGPLTGTSTGNTSGSSDWNKLLAEGSSSPTMMSETPSAPSNKSDAAAPDASANSSNTPSPSPDQVAAAAAATADTANSTPAPADNTTPDKTTPDLAIDTSGSPTTQPGNQPGQTAQRTHIVQPGEMLTSIAAAAYGDARKWKKIAAANPNVNPNRMTPGTKLVLPVLANYTQGPSGTSNGTASAASIDPQTQYQIESGDSLYRISVKLYGDASHVDKLYQDNKEQIGSDPRRLKLNTILKLTDPPTASAAHS